MRWLVLLALVACKTSDAPAPPPAPAPQPAPTPPGAERAVELIDDATSFKALEKKVQLYELRRELRVEAEASTPWPTADVPGLDFTKSGNAIVAYKETGMPFVTISKARPFELLPLEDDPFRATSHVRGIGVRDGAPETEYRDVKYQPALEQMIRAKYVVFVMGNQDQPITAGDIFLPARLSATCLLYEIETKQLLGGVQITATNTAELKLKKGDEDGNLERLMTDFEHNARTALWSALKARFPSVKTP